MNPTSSARLYAAIAAGLLLHAACALTMAAVPDGSRTLRNEQVELAVRIAKESLAGETLFSRQAWAARAGGTRDGFSGTGGFSLELVWTDWRVPGRANNADVAVTLSEKDFTVTQVDASPGALTMLLAGKTTSLQVRLTYELLRDAFFVRRTLALRDTSGGRHYLQSATALRSSVRGSTRILKAGDFGQPVALMLKQGGAFFGLEYPAASNTARTRPGGDVMVECTQERGDVIDREWVSLDPVVQAVTPDRNVKLAFFRYLDYIRVAPLKPYTLYNSWYDLRSAEYPRVPPAHVMNEENVLRIVDLIRENMVRKHNIAIDAVVLDDGWDVYKSDWKLRPEQFPNGLKPVSEAVGKMNSSLGIWYGPTGGYSFHRERVGWMRENGYEVVGDMLCLAGTRYSSLFRRRVTDMVEQDGVRYFKWDGIQFSCSEPAHGHPQGIASRRAVLQAVASACEAVRAKNPEVYLNITSGTWLSPWWLKYANQVWMDGADYGYADVPSLSKRDAAITYRDLVLYEDFHRKDLWMPVSNLMTHGIIKGRLEMLGSANESLEKFTDDVVLYFARGVAMWELYVSPDILTEGEWNALAQSIRWAKDRFPILSTTFMVGGDPARGETYGYVHFKGSRGIIAARNPLMAPSKLNVILSPLYGCDRGARDLVVERVYPTRRFLPKTYAAGSGVDLVLDGYETAVFEIYPRNEADIPLVTGGSLETVSSADGGVEISLYPDPGGKLSLLGGKDPGVKNLSIRPQAAPVRELSLEAAGGKSRNAAYASFTVDPSVKEASLALLLRADKGAQEEPGVSVLMGDVPVVAEKDDKESSTAWYLVPVAPGTTQARIEISARKEGQRWSGKLEAWLVCLQEQPSVVVRTNVAPGVSGRPMPPRAWPTGFAAKKVRLGSVPLIIP